MIPESRLERVESGLTPVTPGWFVVNVTDTAWCTNDEWCGVAIFESDEYILQGRPDLTEYVKAHAGFTIRVVQPGRPEGLYHAESVQEDFLVVHGECILVIEDQERRLRTWDFVHCPPMTGHTFIATGDVPCVLIATGNRRDDLVRIHPGSEVAGRHNAGSTVATDEPERRGTWEVKRPARWDELPWSE
jgi:uncharacterized cupin superfamily protein